LYAVAETLDPLPSARGYSVSVDNGKTWSFLESLVSSYRQRPDTIRRRLAIPLRWFTKGSNEFRVSDRLVAFWISFNALYANPQIRPERACIENYVGKNVDLPMAQRYTNDNRTLLEALSQFSVELGRNREKQSISQELAALLRDRPQDYMDLAKTTTLTIYGIRNSLFHGEYDPNSEDDRKRIEVAERLLSLLARDLIAKEMLGVSPPEMRFLTQETLSL